MGNRVKILWLVALLVFVTIVVTVAIRAAVA